MSNRQKVLSYRHVIITRFSVRFSMLTEKAGKLFDCDRLDKRMKVFKTVCVPSIVHQSWKHFFWVILVDSDLPSKYRHEIDSIADKHKFIRVLEWQADYKLSQVSWLEEVDIDINVTHLITTRLDDDDALHIHFTKMIKNYYKRYGCLIKCIQFVTFPRGCIWLHKNNTAGLMNPFNMDFIALGMSLIVTQKFPVNVYGFNHAKLKKSFKLRIKNPPYIYKWLSNKLGRTITPRHFKIASAMISIPTAFPMYIYTMHGCNDSAAKYYSGIFKNGGLSPSGKFLSLFGIVL